MPMLKQDPTIRVAVLSLTQKLSRLRFINKFVSVLT